MCDEKKISTIYDLRSTKKMIIYVLAYIIAFFLYKFIQNGNIQSGVMERVLILNGIFLIIAFFLFNGEIKYFIKNVKGDSSKKIKNFIVATFITIMIVCIVGLLSNALFGSSNTDAQTEAVIGNSNIVVVIITVIVVSPIVEEIVHRMCIFGCLFQRNLFAAYAVSAIFFAFMHVWYDVIFLGNYFELLQMFYYIAMGLCLSFIYEKTENIIYPIITHMAINFFATIPSIT